MYLIESFLMVCAMFYIVDLCFAHADFSELYLVFYSQDCSITAVTIDFVFFQGQGGYLNIKSCFYFLL